MDNNQCECPCCNSEDEFNLKDQQRAMAVLDSERKRLFMSLLDMEERSGVSVNSFWHWVRLRRSPSLFNLIAVAETFGFEVIMRRKEN